MRFHYTNARPCDTGNALPGFAEPDTPSIPRRPTARWRPNALPQTVGQTRSHRSLQELFDSGLIAKALLLAAAALLATALLGYHPFAEDGGIYVAAIKLRLHPELFPGQKALVVAHTGHGVFVRFVAGCMHLLRLPLSTVLLLLQIATILATLAAGASIARQVFPSRASVFGAVAMMACAMGAPVAGTGIYFTDPYLTARSFSTPMLLFAAALLLRRRYAAPAILWCVAAAFHPLMAIWALPLLTAIIAMQTPSPLLSCTALLAGSALAGKVLVNTLHLPATEAMHQAALSRAYWFPGQWQPTEWVGVVVPVALLAFFFLRHASGSPSDEDHSRRVVAGAALCAAALALLVAGLFAHESSTNLLIAQLQPMRTLLLVYAVLFVLLGGSIMETKQAALRTGLALVFFSGTAAGMVFLQTGLYEASGWFEWPGRAPVNGYEQAFLWARTHTPQDALFGMDAAYTVAHGEDAQCFRAIAERDAVPDAAKDGGVASVSPALADVWLAGRTAQAGLNTATDDVRRSRLLPMGVSWVVLPASAETALPCPFRDAATKVCRLRP